MLHLQLMKLSLDLGTTSFELEKNQLTRRQKMIIKSLLWNFNSKLTEHESAIMTIILKNKQSDTEQLPKYCSHTWVVLAEITNRYFSKRHTAFSQCSFFFNCSNVIAILKFSKNQTPRKSEMIFLFRAFKVFKWLIGHSLLFLVQLN